MAKTTVKPTFTISQIQNAINENDVITFESGVYRITKTLVIPSNRVLLMDGAVLRRYCNKPVLQSKADKNTKGYGGACNIKIIGGTIEGMNDCGYSASDMVLLFHSCNVSFIGVTFLDNTGSHAIDLGGCKNTNIIGCKFLGCKSVGKDFREAIQIDYAYAGGIPYFAEGSPCYDDTHCDGVNIIGCEFGASKSYKPQYIAIGTHAQTDSYDYHENIRIERNVATGNGVSAKGYGFFVRLVNMQNVSIVGNVVSNYGRFVYVDPSPSTKASNKGCKYIAITENVVLNSPNNFKACSIYIKAVGTHKASEVNIFNNIYARENSVVCQKVSYLIDKNNAVT